MVVRTADGNYPYGDILLLSLVDLVMREILLDFIPKSQKNKLQRVTMQTRQGPKRVMSYKADFTTQRQKLEWLLKSLDSIWPGCRCKVEVFLYPKSKQTRVRLTQVDDPVGGSVGVSDPDGILITIMDSLKRTSRIEDDSINHISKLEVTVMLED